MRAWKRAGPESACCVRAGRGGAAYASPGPYGSVAAGGFEGGPGFATPPTASRRYPAYDLTSPVMYKGAPPVYNQVGAPRPRFPALLPPSPPRGPLR